MYVERINTSTGVCVYVGVYEKEEEVKQRKRKREKSCVSCSKNVS